VKNYSQNLSGQSVACSVVVRCYNEEKHIGRLLYGITEQTIKDVEIIVVDSGSTDGTITVASRFPVKIISIKPEDFSFGRSLNQGCGQAKGEFIVLASAHVYPLYVDWLSKLLAPFKDPKISLVYGKQVGGENTKFSEHQIFEKWFPDKSNFSQDHPFCNNANAAIRRDIWKQYKYDEDLTGLEDLAWANTTMQAGHSIAYQPDAVVIHLHDEKPLQIFNRYRREAIALKKIFPNEHFNLWDFIRLFLSNTVRDYQQALRSKSLLVNWADILIFRLMQFSGTFRGFSESTQISEQLKYKFYYPNNGLEKTKISIKREKKDSMLIDYRSEDHYYHENN
jgi:glycosyltransferase involved in cell wall biosynthesis